MGDGVLRDQAERLRQLAQQAVRAESGANVATGASPAPGSSGRRSRVLAVTSGKGGVGKTSLSVNLAIALGQSGLDVALIDADLGLANIDLMLGVLPKYDLTSIMSGERTVREVLVDGPAGVKLLAGGSGTADLANLAPRELERVLGVLAEMDGMFDVYVIDTGAGIGRQVMTFVAAADEVLLVTTADPTAVADAYGLVKVLRASNGGSWKATVRVVVTMAESDAESLAVFRRLDQVSKRFLGLPLHYLGCVEKDALVARAVREQRPFSLGQPHSRPARRVRELAGNLVREWEAGAASGTNGVLAKASGTAGAIVAGGRSGLAGAVQRMWRTLRGNVASG